MAAGGISGRGSAAVNASSAAAAQCAVVSLGTCAGVVAVRLRVLVAGLGLTLAARRTVRCRAFRLLRRVLAQYTEGLLLQG